MFQLEPDKSGGGLLGKLLQQKWQNQTNVNEMNE